MTSREQRVVLRMDASFSGRRSIKNRNREKFLLEVIAPAIRGQSCPICLKSLDNHRKAAVITICLHAYCLECIRRWSDLKRRCPLCNAAFHSWFCRFSFSSRQFLTEKLPPFDSRLNIVTETQSSAGREIRRASSESLREGRRSRALPWRRRFGRSGSVPRHVVAERKLQWRASVYKRGNRAVPLSVRTSVKQLLCRDNCVRERILERIEPWIRRELQATLDDPDPSVIVHVASSLYIARLAQGSFGVASSLLGDEDNFLTPLLPFLHGWTEMFWHELRCFAESSLTMEAYDEVVTYVQSR